MASADTMSPQQLEERPANRRARSPRRATDSYRPARHRDRDRDRPEPAPPARAPEKAEKTEEEKRALAKAEYEKLLTMRSGGIYVPPHRLRALQAQIGDDKKSKEFQRMYWDSLKKSINGLINKVSVANIKQIVPELFGENLIRGRGLFCQSMIKAQAASLPFTPILAALVAIVNTKLPNVGELLVQRLVLRFRKAFKRSDKSVCLATCMFMAHLTNQRVVHEVLAAQILLLLLAKPTDDSVEIAVALTKEVGFFLEEMNPQIARACFDQFRTILNEASLEKRTQYMIEVLFQIRKDRYRDHPTIKEEFDLVEEDDQITHKVYLDDEDVKAEDGLNIFKYDEEFETHEEEYKKLKAEILGEDSGEEDGDSDDDSESEDEDDEEQKAIEIKDQSNADLITLRRQIYLTLMSSASPDESTHKLMKLRLPPGQETELVSMIVESASQEKTYLKFYGLMAENFCKLNRMWQGLFEQSFETYYSSIHRYETNKLRNIARVFGHIFSTDSISWQTLGTIHLNEDETTAASRIFIKILFEDMQENLGAAKLTTRLMDETLRLEGLFPRDNARNIRFSINYFTSIKMGYLTEEMRTFLQNMPKPALPAPAAADESDSDSVSSYSSYTASSYSSRSRSPPRTQPLAMDRGRPLSRSMSRTPPRRYREGSYDSGNRSRSRSPSRGRADSVSTRRSVSRDAPRRRMQRRDSRSASPRPRARRGSSSDYSRGPRPRNAWGRDRSRSYDSRSPSPRRRDASIERGPNGRRRAASFMSASRSPEPPARRRRNSSSGPESSRTPRRNRGPPDPRSPREARRDDAPRGRGRDSYSRSPAPVAARARDDFSPPPRDGRGRVRPDSRKASPTGVKRRRRYSSESRSSSPVPAKRGRRSS